MSRLILPSGRTYENLCVGCDRFHQECCAAVARTPLARIGLDPIPDALSSLPPAHSVFWPRSIAHARSGCLHRPRRPSLRRRPATHRLRHRPAARPASLQPRLVLQAENLRFPGSTPYVFNRDNDYFAFLQQTLESSGKRGLACRARLARPPRRRARAEILRRQIAFRVRHAYWSAAGAKRSHGFLIESQKNFQQVVEYHGSASAKRHGRKRPPVRLESERIMLSANNAKLIPSAPASSSTVKWASPNSDARLADPLELKDDRLLLADIEQAVQRRAEFSSPAPRSIAPAPLSSSNRPTPAPTTTCSSATNAPPARHHRRCPDRSALPQPQSGQHRIRRRRHKDRRATSPPPKPSSAPRSPPPTSNTKCAAARSPISSAASANRPPKPPHRTSRLPPRRRRSPPPARRRTSPHRN